MKNRKGIPRDVKTSMLCVVFLVASAVFSAADEVEVIAELQAAEELSYRDGAYAVMVAAGILPGSASPEAALNPALRGMLGWDSRPIDEPLTVSGFSVLVMEGFDIPGGLMYRIAPGPRYAVRALRFRRILLERLDANDRITGVEALRIIGNAIEWTEARS